MTKAAGNFLLVLTMFSFFTGCAWRTKDADHVFGPALYRFSQSTNRAVFVQTLHVPMLFEGGRQWGLSVGGVQRLAMVPQRVNKPSVDVGAPAEGSVARADSERWQMSWIYLRAPLRAPPVFIRRSVVGLHGGAGFEERAFSLGYSSMTATTPHDDAVYRLEFNSRRPLDATFVENPMAETEAIQQQPLQNREQP